MPTEMTMRDHFAAAALTGLLASGMDSVDEMPTRAYRMADAMLRERTNHDAAPAARADLPDECPPNAVSANGGTPCAASRDGSGTGGTQEPVACDTNERSVASAGSVAGEPAAWAVLDSRGMVCVAYICREAAEAYCDGTFNRLAPLYRQPQPTLTDAELEAVKTAMNAYGSDNANPECAAIEATLWGLLERTK